MPVRKVPKHSHSLTGLVCNTRSSSMTAFESALERDFFLLLDFDPEVACYEEQPVTIAYHDGHKRRSYTPDVLVRYRSPHSPFPHRPPLLCEVKYRADLRQHWRAYRPKFRAAQHYARQQGWRFRLVTERHVRTPYLDNVKFLRRYRLMPVNDSSRAQILDTLVALEDTDPARLLATIAHDRWHHAQLLPIVWQLVATRQIGADLAHPLTMHSRIWLAQR